MVVLTWLSWDVFCLYVVAQSTCYSEASLSTYINGVLPWDYQAL